MYYNGWGVPQDYSAAVSWYRKAAEQGHADAQNNLGFSYSQGHGVPKDYAAAVSWYVKLPTKAIVKRS
jgi:TPR repeat protein